MFGRRTTDQAGPRRIAPPQPQVQTQQSQPTAAARPAGPRAGNICSCSASCAGA